MGAIEPARQAGSTDTKLDHQLDHDGFAVGILVPSDVGINKAFSECLQMEPFCFKICFYLYICFKKIIGFGFFDIFHDFSR